MLTLCKTMNYGLHGIAQRIVKSPQALRKRRGSNYRNPLDNLVLHIGGMEFTYQIRSSDAFEKFFTQNISTKTNLNTFRSNTKNYESVGDVDSRTNQTPRTMKSTTLHAVAK